MRESYNKLLYNVLLAKIKEENKHNHLTDKSLHFYAYFYFLCINTATIYSFKTLKKILASR